MHFPFPCSPVIHECSWKKIQIEKKKKSISRTGNLIWDALRNSVRFAQFKKREKHPWRSVTFSKVAGYYKLKVFFTFFKLYKWYWIVQRISYVQLNDAHGVQQRLSLQATSITAVSNKCCFLCILEKYELNIYNGVSFKEKLWVPSFQLY